MQKSNLEGLKRGGMMCSSRIESYQNNLKTSICGLRVYPNQDSAESPAKTQMPCPAHQRHGCTTLQRGGENIILANLLPPLTFAQSENRHANKRPRLGQIATGEFSLTGLLAFFSPPSIIKLYKGQCIKEGRLVMIPTLYCVLKNYVAPNCSTNIDGLLRKQSII